MNGALDDMVVSGRYVVTGGSSASGDVVSVRRLSTGAFLWGTATNDCNDITRILVVGGVVLYNACITEGSSALFGNDLATGAQKRTRAGYWTPDAGDTDAITGKDVYLTNFHGYITDIAPQTGDIRGTFPRSAHTVLVVGRSRLFTTCAAGVCAYSRATRKLLWSHPDASSGGLAAVGGTVL